MSGSTRNLEQEFWRPPERAPQPVAAAEPLSLPVCPQCSASQPSGARFCPSCGYPRDATANPPFLAAWSHLRRALGLGNAALLAFAVGLLSLVIAVLLSSFYSATTTIEWQAIQLWRIQWLLAAVAALVAGILLKNAR